MNVHARNPITGLPRCARTFWRRLWFRIVGFDVPKRNAAGLVVRHIECEQCAKELLERLLVLSRDDLARVFDKGPA